MDIVQDLSKTVTYALLVGILAFYIVSGVDGLRDPRDFPDYFWYDQKIKNWAPEQWLQGYDYHVKHSLSKASIEWFDNPKTVPLILSIALVGATYLLAVQLSGKRYAGVLAALIMILSNIFRHFDASQPYPNDWVLFLVLSLYFAKKAWYLMPLMFGLGVLSKPLIILFIPMILYYFVQLNPQRIRRIPILVLFGVMIISGAFLMPFRGGDWTFNGMGFLTGLGAGMYFFMIPDFWLAALFPVSMITLLVLGLKRVPNAYVVLLGMGTAMFHGGFLEGFTTHWWNEPYRYIPLIVFFAVSIGVIIEGIKQRRREKLLRIQ